MSTEIPLSLLVSVWWLHFGAFIIWHVGHLILKGCWDRWIGMTCKCWLSENWTGRRLGYLLSRVSHTNSIEILGLLEEHSFVSVLQQLSEFCVFSECCTPKLSFSGILKVGTNYFQKKVMNGFTSSGHTFLASWCWKLSREVMEAEEEQFSAFIKQILSWLRLRWSGMLYSLFHNSSC